MLGITEINRILSGVDKELYKRFCVINRVKGIGYADIGILEDKFRALKFPFIDHALFMYTFDEEVLLVTNPYMSDEDCKEYLKSRCLEGEICGKDNSFYSKGSTNLVKIKVVVCLNER